jgi:biotin transport system substrate-specific component
MQLTNENPGVTGSTGSATARHRWNATDLSLIAVFAALLAALAILPAIPVGPLSVPITLQTLGIMLAGLVLGPARGGAAVGLYLVAGMAGLPVFAGFRGGLGVLAGPSAGYLIAFPLTALLCGYLAWLALRRTVRFRFAALFGASMAGTLLVNHPLGIVGMMVNGKLDLATAVAADVVYLPGDVVKNLLAAAIALSVHKAFPRLAGSPGGNPAPR